MGEEKKEVPVAAPPPPLFHAPKQLVPLQTHKGRLVLNSSFSCGSHWLCICPALARLACPVPAAPSCPGCRLLWSWGLGPQRPPSKFRAVYSTEGGRSRAGHTGSPHIASSSGQLNSSVSQADANQSLAALVPGAETLLAVVAPVVLAGAVCLLQSAGVCPKGMEKLTPSLSFQA